jgi:hypothetical protein
MANYLDENGLQEFSERLTARYKNIFATKGQVGAPLKAATVSAMTDTSKIYVYTGTQTGYIAGNWYYHNGSAWVSGGVYNSTAFNADTTLSVPGDAADSKTVGDNFEDVRSVASFDEFLANSGEYNITANDLVSGVWNYSIPAANSARARTKFLFPVRAGMTITYTNNTFDTYFGLLRTRTSLNYDALYGWRTDAGATLIVPKDGFLTFIIRNHADNSAEVDPAAFDGTVVIESEIGRLNDAKIENSFNILDGILAEVSQTVNNVTFTWNNHACTIMNNDGPASANSANVLIYRENLPSYVKPKETYFFNCNSNFDSSVSIRFVFYDNELNTLSNKTYSCNSKDAPVVVPSGATKWSFSIFVASGFTVSGTIISDIRLLYAKSNKMLEKIADHAQSQLSDFNAYDVLEGRLNKTNQRTYGVVFDWAGDVCEITRPSTQNYPASFPLLNDVLPDVIVPGETYRVIYETTNDDIRLTIQLSNSDGSIAPSIDFYESGNLYVPDYATRWSLTLYVPTTTDLSTPAVVSKIQIVSTKTNQELTEITEKTKNDVIQFNSYDIFSDYIRKTNETIGAVTFTWNGDTCYITGGEIGSDVNYVLIPRSAFPYGVEPGGTYHVKFKTNYEWVWLSFEFFDSEFNQLTGRIVQFDYDVTILPNAAYWRVYLHAESFYNQPNPIVVNNIHFLSAKTNLELESFTDNLSETVRDNEYLINDGALMLVRDDRDIEQGQWSFSKKDNVTNYSTRIRSTRLIPVRAGMQIMYFNETLDRFFGVLETPTSMSYLQTIGWRTDKYGIIDITKDGYLTYVLRKHDDPTEEIHTWYYDGNAFLYTALNKTNALVGFNTNDYFYGRLRKNTETVDGVTYAWSADGESCTISGTLSGSTSMSVIIPKSDLPSGVLPWKTYFVDFYTTNRRTNLMFNFYADGQDDPVYGVFKNSSDNKTEFSFPGNIQATKWEVSLMVGSQLGNGDVVERIRFFDSKSNQELTEDVGKLKTVFNATGNNVSIGDSNDTFVLGGKRLVFNEDGTITWVAN